MSFLIPVPSWMSGLLQVWCQLKAHNADTYRTANLSLLVLWVLSLQKVQIAAGCTGLQLSLLLRPEFLPSLPAQSHQGHLLGSPALLQDCQRPTSSRQLTLITFLKQGLQLHFNKCIWQPHLNDTILVLVLVRHAPFVCETLLSNFLMQAYVIKTSKTLEQIPLLS